MLKKLNILLSPKFLIIRLATLQVISCAPSVEKISQRSPDLFEKESHSSGHPGQAAAPSSLYMRQKIVEIKPEDPVNEAGSLFNIDNENNYLFTSSVPVNTGRFLTILVNSSRLDQLKPQDQNAAADKPGTSKPADGSGDELTNSLLKAIPELTPAKKDAPVAIKRFRAKVTHRFENGDVLVSYSRNSQADGNNNEIMVTARVPHKNLTSGEPITTDDLFDVNFMERSEGTLAEQQSSGWEDEYTLRLSGFDEAKSKMAMELDDQRRRLQEARDSLETRIKTFGDERRQLAKQREDLNKKAQNDQEKMTQMQKTIEEQKQTIDSFKPEEKQGDKKDGSEG